MALDHTDWRAKGDELRRRRRWEEAFRAYDRSLALTPGDTVSHSDDMEADRGRRECLEVLSGPVLRQALAGLTARALRGGDSLEVRARELRQGRFGVRADTARAVFRRLLAMDDAAFGAAVHRARGAAGVRLPIADLRGFLSRLGSRQKS